jgi:hypothetical protein
MMVYPEHVFVNVSVKLTEDAHQSFFAKETTGLSPKSTRFPKIQLRQFDALPSCESWQIVNALRWDLRPFILRVEPR